MDAHAEKIAPDLRQRWQADPAQEVHAILRVTDTGPQVAETIERAGLEIYQRTTLVPTFAVRGPAWAVLDLLPEPWLVRVEEDRPVHTL